MQKELSKGPLLDSKGNLIESGYSFNLVKEYSRSAIKGLKTRIKEWDYYFIYDDNYGIALTIDDNSYLGMGSISVIDFKNKKDDTKTIIKWFTFGKTNFPSNSINGDVSISGKDFSLSFENKNTKRHIVCKMKNLIKGKDFVCDLFVEPTLDKTMVIATPFKKKKHFYYNQKINLLKAIGTFSFGDINYTFPNTTLGVLDWGRGVWTYKNTWYWASLNYHHNGHNIGFNLGYGFGNNTSASENMFFYDNDAYKLEDVYFHIPKNKKGKLDYMQKWIINSSSGDINLEFTPILDRYANTNAILIQSLQNQVFGYFNGIIKIKDKEYKLDNLLGFAERVYNRL